MKVFHAKMKRISDTSLVNAPPKLPSPRPPTKHKRHCYVHNASVVLSNNAMACEDPDPPSHGNDLFKRKREERAPFNRILFAIWHRHVYMPLWVGTGTTALPPCDRPEACRNLAQGPRARAVPQPVTRL